MRNDLIMSKGLMYGMVIPAHVAEFEKDIMEIYYESIYNEELIPHLNEDIMYYSNPKYMVAGIQSSIYQDDDYFSRATEHLDDTEEMDYVMKYLKEYDNEVLMPNAMQSFQNDLEMLLQFHHFFYAEDALDFMTMKIVRVIRNMPILEVW